MGVSGTQAPPAGAAGLDAGWGGNVGGDAESAKAGGDAAGMFSTYQKPILIGGGLLLLLLGGWYLWRKKKKA